MRVSLVKIFNARQTKQYGKSLTFCLLRFKTSSLTFKVLVFQAELLTLNNFSNK